MLPKSLNAVLATCRMIATAAGHPGGNDQLVKSDKSYKQVLHELPEEMIGS